MENADSSQLLAECSVDRDQSQRALKSPGRHFDHCNATSGLPRTRDGQVQELPTIQYNNIGRLYRGISRHVRKTTHYEVHCFCYSNLILTQQPCSTSTFTARHHVSAVYTTAVCPFVRLSVTHTSEFY